MEKQFVFLIASANVNCSRTVSRDQTMEKAHALAELPAAKHLSWKVVRTTVLALWIAKRYDVSKFAAGV